MQNFAIKLAKIFKRRLTGGEKWEISALHREGYVGEACLESHSAGVTNFKNAHNLGQ